MASRPIKDEQLKEQGAQQPVYGGSSKGDNTEVKIFPKKGE